jgi:crotonobetainyl-CoA:carnitine CoA-transferase CaiB-like acyl-CoA transferase
VANGVLHGVRIVDVSDTLAANVATMVLAEAGADVVLVEPPGGAASRADTGFRTWNRSKRSVEIDLRNPLSRGGQLDALLACADVLVHSFGPTRARALGLDDASLAVRHPDLVVSSVLGWPANHQNADLPVDELLTMARAGFLDEQQGHRDGPIYLRFPLGTWGAAWLAAIGIAARLFSRERGGTAGPAHTSLAQGALVPMMMHWSRAQRPSPMLRAGMPKTYEATVFECADGAWIHTMPPRAGAAARVREARTELRDAIDVAIVAFHDHAAASEVFKTRPAREWLEHLWASDVPAQEVMPLGAVLRDEQARANAYVIDIDDPDAGRITVPGPPLTIDPPARVQRLAPRPGEHTAEVISEWTPRAHGARPSGRVDRWPLEGVKVLDFGMYLAGPLGPMLLADLGADVVKVEPTTGDQMRGADWPFAGCQRGKRDVALDLKSPASRPALEALLRWADVVHHNLRMPAARRLGLDATGVRAVNPDAIFCHTSSYGPEGPRANWPGYDQLFQSSCGWESAGAGEGNPPMWHRFGFTDHLCAMASAVATIVAMYHKDRTGRSTDVAASLLGATVLTNGETFLDGDGAVAPIRVLDADQARMGPGDRILQTADGWVAVAARTTVELDRLFSASGCTSEIDLPVAVRARSSDDVLADLTAAGVPCAPVRLDQREAFFDDAANHAAGMVARYEHAAWGMFEQPGALWHFGNLDTRLELAPPVLGEHTVDVLLDVGLGRDAIDRLLADRVAVASPPR